MSDLSKDREARRQRAKAAAASISYGPTQTGTVDGLRDGDFVEILGGGQFRKVRVDGIVDRVTEAGPEWSDCGKVLEVRGHKYAWNWLAPVTFRRPIGG